MNSRLLDEVSEIRRVVILDANINDRKEGRKEGSCSERELERLYSP